MKNISTHTSTSTHIRVCVYLCGYNKLHFNTYTHRDTDT